jgi:hypothetical protein
VQVHESAFSVLESERKRLYVEAEGGPAFEAMRMVF